MAIKSRVIFNLLQSCHFPRENHIQRRDKIIRRKFPLDDIPFEVRTLFKYISCFIFQIPVEVIL